MGGGGEELGGVSGKGRWVSGLLTTLGCTKFLGRGPEMITPSSHTHPHTYKVHERNRPERISVKDEHIQAPPSRPASVRATVGRVGAPRSTVAAQLIIPGPHL